MSPNLLKKSLIKKIMFCAWDLRSLERMQRLKGWKNLSFMYSKLRSSFQKLLETFATRNFPEFANLGQLAKIHEGKNSLLTDLWKFMSANFFRKFNVFFAFSEPLSFKVLLPFLSKSCYSIHNYHYTKKRSFLLRISSVNVTKSTGNCGFGQIYWRNLNEKLHFLCNVFFKCFRYLQWRTHNWQLAIFLDFWVFIKSSTFELNRFCYFFLKKFFWNALHEKCPNTKFFLVRIFPHSDWIRKDTSYLSVFSPNAEK